MRSILLKREYVFYGNLILVNGEHKIKEEVKKYNLKPFDEKYPNILLDYNANLELQNILKEIGSERKIVPVSGYRDFTEQVEIYENSLKENGERFTKKYVAYPNCSEHQTGLAIDLALSQKNIDFIRPKFPYTGICKKFRNVMAEYGFIERYTKDKEQITRIASEEWHFRYVGFPHSKIIIQNHMCLEEYIQYLKDFEFGKKALTFEGYEISYIKMNEDMKQIQIEDNEMITISGNNDDGIIITKKVRK
ncbi:MAG: D-alanyl-D-alanine carboxypeptidase family protein [Clostridia bacterium]|nr:D-alanyl-D-alanine carboxypeptidase family protein [Clostridia bacterium]